MFSKKNIFLKGTKHPFSGAASRVLNSSASSTIYKCWSRGTNKTSAILRTVKNEGWRRAYATHSSGPGSNPNDFDPNNLGKALPFYRKLINAWTQTPTKWYPLPIAVGAILLVAIQYRKKRKGSSKQVELDDDGIEIIKLQGPWQVHVLGALPLRNMSRIWGYLNSLELPIWFRPIGLRIYATAFGCNLDEIEPADLRAYASLGDFFYRKLKQDARPVDPDAILVSPADGRILHFGTVQDLRVEQVKGMSYSLDALLGVERPGTPPPHVAPSHRDKMPVVDDHEFANVNGIEYSLNQLIGLSSPIDSTPPTPSRERSERESSVAAATDLPKKFGDRIDASVPQKDLQETLAHDASVALSMGVQPALERKRSSISGGASSVRPGNSLYFTVIYLAPGDYHRFHSPTAWVVEKRRHFVGELFSVSPYMAKRLQNLFVLNERVALLGKWRYGFFGMVPVGATNVGSIKINFDQALRTNVRGPSPPPGTYSEAVYSAASPILNGQPLLTAQEMGGFCLGSTIVLVFEAPSDEFEFTIKAGDKVKVGQRLGDLKANLERMRKEEGKVKTE
ncbi:phosphatidylserine decarboxylase 1 [Dendrothele bispora CBS 962.96]|uniref:Phosphatidylserine decarboxylase proenzyme 1, mitochondrial n=1 Tax=Dendrothele bispora (strain CBS 962.96) TaxID=1314807 RepID=A0A4V4HIT7_DENBC|nr:phosphatidylserine decarboxylase 1 [Dendrothele bispora CBS 962.96]